MYLRLDKKARGNIEKSNKRSLNSRSDWEDISIGKIKYLEQRGFRREIRAGGGGKAGLGWNETDR